MSTRCHCPDLYLLVFIVALLAAYQFSILSRHVPMYLVSPGSESQNGDDPTIVITNSTQAVNSISDQSDLLINNSNLNSGNGSFPLRNDKTISWSTDVHRVWLQPTDTDRPPALLMITNFGWNGDDHDLGLRLIRTTRSRELLQGVMNHPWFHPTAWEDLNSGRMSIDNVTRYYIFLDIETCFERNYPIYADGGLETNSDEQFGRGSFRGRRRHCDAMRQALRSPVMRTPAGAKIVYFDCAGNGPQNCGSREETQSPRVALASISASENQHYRNLDQGLPPPAPRPVELTDEQVHEIDMCNETSRPYLMTFAGRDKRELRHRLFDLHNGEDVIIERKPRGLNMPAYLGGGTNYSYEGLLAQSKFAAVPRGDNLFSYRFTEALSAGAIPIVFADAWVLPFRENVVDWARCCAVIISEGQVKGTVKLIKSISEKRRCELRKNGYEVYRRYVKDGEGVVAGLIQGLEYETAVATGEKQAFRVS